MCKRSTQEEVEKIFSDEGCSFDDVYMGVKYSYNYTCSCGNKSKIRIKDFKKGGRCMNCKGRPKYTYEYVYTYFKDNGCLLLELEYIDSRTLMRYICKCGNLSKITFIRFKAGSRCMSCGGCKKYTYEYVYNYFKKHGCKLLETYYKDANTLMRYICKCGKESTISFSTFKSGGRCRKCGSKKMAESKKGHNNPSWINNREKIPLVRRLRKSFSRKWALNNMNHDPNYEDFKENPEQYNTDHIISISLFRDLVFEYNLDEIKIKEIINQRDNLQLLTIKENSKKYKYGCINEAKEYLIKHGIQLI